MIAENIDRRQLDTGQRAFVAQDMRAYVDAEAKKRKEIGSRIGGMGGYEAVADKEMPKSASPSMVHPDSPKSFVIPEQGDRRSARSELARMFNTNNEYIDKARDLTCRGARCTPRYGVSGGSGGSDLLAPMVHIGSTPA